VWLALGEPAIALAAPRPVAQAPSEAAAASDQDPLDAALKDIGGTLEALHAGLTRGEDTAERRVRLNALRETVEGLDRTELSDFDRIERRLRDHGLPQLVLDRHADAVRRHKAAVAALRASLDSIDGAGDDQQRLVAVAQARQHLKAERRIRPRFDPKRLPTQVLEPNGDNKPKVNVAEFRRAVLDSSSAVRVSALESNPTAQAASNAAFQVTALPGADDPAFLAPTAEIVFTDAVRQRALSLEGNPVKIFNWAHDNLEWSPGWGAIQGAEHTLGSGRGNAIDLAGALIALLRVSGVPARYVHGTVEMEAERFKALVGTFDNVTAAVDFASASGLPVASVVSGGRIVRVRFEHVWVEAAVDFFPSRGAINRIADRWVEIDPAIKRVQIHATPDYAALSGVATESVLQAFAASGTADPSAGWVQGLDTAGLDAGLTPSPEAQAQVAAAARTFFQGTYRPSDTVSLAQIAGGVRATPRTDGVLPAGLPYTVLLVGARYAQIPAPLQGQATISFGFDFEGFPIAPVTLPLARVNNEDLTLSFSFASVADHDTYVSFLPAGPVTSLSQLPATVPGYLVSVVPQFRLGGQVIAQAPPVRLGETVGLGVGLRLPGVAGVRDRSSSVVAGSQLAVLVFAGSANTARFERVRQRYAEADALLTNGSVDDILHYASNFTLRLSGDAFHAGALEYFARRLATAELLTTSARLGRFQLVAGVASFGYVPTPRFRFGIPRNLALGALQVDAPNLLVNVQSTSGDPELRRLLMLRIGMLGSSLEADVPAQLWSSDLSTPDTGVSAANNLRRALAAGQRIYRLTQANRGSIAQLQLSADALSDITASVDAGFEVIAHQSPIAVTGRAGTFTTAGYVVLDPVTGAGQYLIDNGTNGGLANTADEMMATCAYMNRPGFVDNDLDWERFQITRRCADVAKGLKEQAAESNAKLMEAKIKAVIEYHEVYAKVPLVIADCITAGAPLILSEALVLIRTAAAMLAIVTADMRSLIIAEQQLKLAKKLKEFVEFVHKFCMRTP
jgi:transglutaminase-like putative cysteine protease